MTWIRNARHIALPQSVTPALIAISMAATHPSYQWWLSLLALIGVAAAHLGMNLLDDYFDYKSGTGETREKMASEGIRARIAKYEYLTSGRNSIKQLLIAITLFLSLAAIIGVIIAYFQGQKILILMAIGAVLGYSYSGKPMPLGYWGLGELVIGIMFGPLLMIGVQAASSGVIDMPIIIVGSAIGLLVTNIIFSHSMMDKNADEKAGKMTFARLLKTPTNELIFSAILNTAPYIIIAIGVAIKELHPAYLFTLIQFPLGIYLWNSLRRFQNGDKQEIRPRRWMGNMGQFELYKEAGIDWFMLRWLIARNQVTHTSLVIVIINVVLAILNS